MAVTMPDPGLALAGPSGPCGQPTTLESYGQIADLAAWLQSPYRDRVVLVLTVAQGGVGPCLAPDAIAAEHADAAEVYIVRNGGLTKRLAHLLPTDCDVFGGGARIYPMWRDWQGSRLKAPLYLARNPGEQENLRNRVPLELRRIVAGTTSPVHPSAAAGEFAADGGIHRLETDDDAAPLARYLQHPARTFPVVALSVHPDAGGAPYIDAADMAKELAGLAVVAVLSPDATFGLTEALGDRTLSVFFGAARVYPIGTAWLDDTYLAPLRMCSGWEAASKVGRTVLEDALAAANAAGLLGRAVAAPEDRVADGRITGRMGELHSLVKLSTGGQALLLNADLSHGVPYDRLLAPGLELSGRTRGRGLLPKFVPDAIKDDPQGRARALFKDGAPALARVVDVTAESAELELHPQVRGVLRRDSADDNLRDLLSVDDVVAVTVWWLAEGLQFAFADVDASPISMGVLPKGPDWLRPEDLEPVAAEPEAEPEPVAPIHANPTAPPPGTAAEGPVRASGPIATEVRRLSRELSLARAQIDVLQDELKARGVEIGRLQEQAGGARRKARRAKAQAAHRPVFEDPAAQLRHEIWLAWLRRFAKAERQEHALADDYGFGPGFFASLDELQGINRSKVVDVLVEVLTGLDQRIPGRQLHPWQEGRGGAQQQRADGGRAWRVSLQIETAGARRLKYWRMPGGAIEFDTVGHHDDGLAKRG